MPNIIKWLVFIAGIALIFAAGCTISRDYNEERHPPPDGWMPGASQDNENCNSINGEYDNLGTGRQAKNGPLIEARLDVVLGHTSPSAIMPVHVRVTLDKDSSVLTYQFSGPANESFSVPVICVNGWYEWTKTMSDRYLGDGGNLDYSYRRIRANRATDDGLIVNLHLDARFSSLGVFKSHYKRETWSKFDRVGYSSK